MRSGLAVGLLLAVVSVSPCLQAQPSDPATMVEHGLALRRERRDADALDEFRRAYALEAAPRTLAQIALAEQALGRWVDAEADLQRAISTKSDPWIAANKRVLAAGLATIEGHLGSLDVAADVPGAELSINGAYVGELPLAEPLRVEAGSVVIEVRAVGYATARRLTSVEPGGSARESVQLVSLAAPSSLPSPAAATAAAGPPSPSAPAPVVVTRGDRPMRNVSFVLLGAGALELIAGAYFGVRTLETKSDRDGNCQGQACNPTGVALDGQARSLATQSSVWLAGGVLTAGVGVALFLMSGSPVLPAPSTALRLSLDAGPDRASAGLGGSW